MHWVDSGESFSGHVGADFARKHAKHQLAGGETLVLNAAHNATHVASKTFYAAQEVTGSLATGEWLIVRWSTNKVDSRFGNHWINVPNIRFRIRRLVNGIHLYPKDVARLKIHLPPLPEQKRIAGILDAADALRDRRREAITQLDYLLRSTFLDMFGDPFTNPKGWAVTCVGDATQMGTGSTPSRSHKSYFDGNIPWVKSTDVDWGTVTATSECLSTDGAEAARLKVYPKGSIVLALYGQGKTRGKCAILGIDATVNQACCALVPRDLDSTPYLFQFLKFSYHRLRRESRGGNQENLNMGIVRSFPVPMPPLEVQKQYAIISESIREHRERQFAHLAELDTLFAALRSRAFRGDL